MNRFTTCLLVFCTFLPGAAFAQLSGGSGSGVASAPAIQPRARTPDFAPPAVPGAGGSTLVTSLPVPKANAGDPTTELFTAVNSGDYNGAQDAVSRGADINAQNALGESPLDLSIALNRNSITFMLLSARNESADAGSVGAPWPVAPASPGSATRRSTRLHATPARMVSQPRLKPLPPVSTAGAGTPNPAAGFLGFGQAQ